MNKLQSTLWFVLKFAVLGLALAFAISAFAPQLTTRLRATLGNEPEHPPAAASAPTEEQAHAPAEREPASGSRVPFEPEREGPAVS
jgi:hypothetical protein